MRLLSQDDQQDEPAPLTVKEGPPVEILQFSDHGACVAFYLRSCVVFKKPNHVQMWRL